MLSPGASFPGKPRTGASSRLNNKLALSNYVTITLKEGNLADYTVYKYISGVATPTIYENCVAICTSVKKSGIYYYVIKVYFSGLNYHEIYFTIDGNLSGAHKVVKWKRALLL